jgi:hypothetical protein
MMEMVLLRLCKLCLDERGGRGRSPTSLFTELVGESAPLRSAASESASSRLEVWAMGKNWVSSWLGVEKLDPMEDTMDDLAVSLEF